MLGWSCKAPAFQIPRLNFLIPRPISSPPPFFLSLRLEVATAAQLSALVMEGRGAQCDAKWQGFIWKSCSDRTLRLTSLLFFFVFFLPSVCADFKSREREKAGRVKRHEMGEIKWRECHIKEMENRKEDDRFASYATKQASNEQQINSRQKKKKKPLRPSSLLYSHAQTQRALWEFLIIMHWLLSIKVLSSFFSP